MAGYASSTGAGNVFLGREAGRGLGGAYTGANNNVVIGYRAEYDCAADLVGDTAIGYQSGYYNRNGVYNVFLGFESGKGGAAYTGADYNVAIGYQAGVAVTTNSVQNVMLGAVAGYSYAGSYMTAVGYRTLYSTTGVGNTALGYLAGQRCSTGTYNTFVGHEAGYGGANPYAGSDYNVAVGYRAGYDISAAALNNTLIGALAGENLTTGDSCVCLGYNAGGNHTTAGDKLYLANTKDVSLLYGDFATSKLGLKWDTSTATPIAPTYDLSIYFASDLTTRTFGVLRTPVGSEPMGGEGTGLSIYAGGADPDFNNANGGSLILLPGVTTGTGISSLYLGSYAAGVAGHADNAPVYTLQTGSCGVYIGPGTTAPTAYLHLKAGGTAASTAPLKFTDGNTLATIEQGAVEMYKSTLWFQPSATLIKQSLDGTIFSQTTAVTAANVDVATTLVGAGRGDAASPINLPANYFALAGKTLRVTARGYYSTSGGGGPYTLILSVALADVGGDTVLLQTAALEVTGRSSLGWEIQGDITCYSTGATGTFWGQGFAKLASATTTTDVLQMVNTAVDTNMDTTSAMTLDVKATWNTADAGNTITCTNLIVEALD
jgi:hypothetical protein